MVKVHYSDICKSQLRRSDTRAAMCVKNIFYKTNKLQMKITLGKSHIAQISQCRKIEATGNIRRFNSS